MKSTLITIKTFDNSIDAHLLKMKLENEGITCFLFDENIVSVNPLYNIAVGGIKLKIEEENIDKAREIIVRADKAVLTKNNGEIVACPNCKSTDFYLGFKSIKNLRGVLATLLAFLFMVFPFYYKNVFKCKQCGTEFSNLNA